MRRFLHIALFVFSISVNLFAQTPSHRLRFKYVLSNKYLNSLNKDGYEIRDTNGQTFQLCVKTRLYRFKFLINQKDNVLYIDPWAIGENVSRKRDKPDSNLISCENQPGVINSKTPNNLFFEIKKRVIIGEPTKVLRLRYRSWIIGFNSVSIKFRPAVKNYKDSIYAANVMAGVSLGISAGHSFGWTNFTHRGSNSWSITPSFGFGFSAQSLDKQPLIKEMKAPSEGQLVISPSLSCIFARNDIGLILSYGKDYMMGQNGSAWAYQGKGYFGVGISAGFKL